MSYVIKRPWRSQPQQSPGVDWANPITKRLVFLTVGNSRRNFANGGQATGGTTTGYGAAGSAIQGDGANYLSFGSRDPALLATGETTALAVVSDLGKVAAYSTLSPFSCGSAWDVGIAFLLYHDGADSLFGGLSGGGSSLNDQRFGQIPTGVAILSASSAHNVANGSNVYLNGREGNSYTNTNAAALTGARDSYVGYVLPQPSVGLPSGLKIYLVAAWNRILSRAEHAALAANPWQLFEPRRAALPASAAGPAPFPTLSNAIMDPITSTGGVPKVDYAF